MRKKQQGGAIDASFDPSKFMGLRPTPQGYTPRFDFGTFRQTQKSDLAPTTTPILSNGPTPTSIQTEPEFGINYNHIAGMNAIKGIAAFLRGKQQQKDFNSYNNVQSNPLLQIEGNPNTSNESLYGMKKGGWLKGAVNPKHKGYCTPMTKSTCTGHRKAFAEMMKKKHGFHQDGGQIGHTGIKDTFDDRFDLADLVNYSVATGQKPSRTLGVKDLAVSNKDLYTYLSIFNQRPDLQGMSPEQRIRTFYDIPSNNPNIQKTKDSLKALGYGPISNYEDTPDARIQEFKNAIKFQKGGTLGTVLDKTQQVKYDVWKSNLPKNLQYDGNYDLKGLWLSNPNAQPAPNLHFPDTYKLPNHPTFSNESKYFNSLNKNLAGHWQETDSSYNYIPYDNIMKDTIVEKKVMKRGGKKMQEGGDPFETEFERGLFEEDNVQPIDTPEVGQQIQQPEQEEQIDNTQYDPNRFSIRHQYADIPADQVGQSTYVEPSQPNIQTNTQPEQKLSEVPDLLEAFKRGISNVESQGDYNAASPYSSARGKYQFTKATREGVRGSYFPNMSKEAFEQAYKSNPQFQERVMDKYSSYLLGKYKDPKQAATAFFLGEGNANKYTDANYRPTPNNATVGQYLKKFDKGFYQQGGAIQVNNPNDPRLRRYQDSLRASKYSTDLVNKISNTNQPSTPEEFIKYRNSLDMKYDINGIKPTGSQFINMKNYNPRKDISIMTPYYTPPIESIVYNKPNPPRDYGTAKVNAISNPSQNINVQPRSFNPTQPIDTGITYDDIPTGPYSPQKGKVAHRGSEILGYQDSNGNQVDPSYFGIIDVNKKRMGGKVPGYKQGGEYEVSEQEIQRLKKQGYKFDIL